MTNDPTHSKFQDKAKTKCNPSENHHTEDLGVGKLGIWGRPKPISTQVEPHAAEGTLDNTPARVQVQALESVQPDKGLQSNTSKGCHPTSCTRLRSFVKIKIHKFKNSWLSIECGNVLSLSRFLQISSYLMSWIPPQQTHVTKASAAPGKPRHDGRPFMIQLQLSQYRNMTHMLHKNWLRLSQFLCKMFVIFLYKKIYMCRYTHLS